MIEARHLTHLSRRLACSLLVCALLAGISQSAHAAGPQRKLPAETLKALRAAHVPARSMSVAVLDAGSGEPLMMYRADQALNPASVMKLVTTYAALDKLGPGFTWTTRWSAYGQMQGSVLQGNVVIRGGGDPKLVVERLVPMLQAVRSRGISRINGDIILDRRHFALGGADPAEFDGEPLRPYNATPDALLINFKSLVMTFTPDAAAGVARVSIEPPMEGLESQWQVPLVDGDCGDWRGQLRAGLTDPERLRFEGRYASSCGERIWPTAYADPTRHAERAIAGLWKQQGGQLSGKVREWSSADEAITQQKPLWQASFDSLPLREIIRDINKFSNNVMARQLMLTLGVQLEAQQATQDTLAAGQSALSKWWKSRWPRLPEPIIENGSGLSRKERIRPDALAQMLMSAWRSPLGAVLQESLPIAGTDPTLKSYTRTQVDLSGRAFLKTGTLRDVVAVAGYVDTDKGKRVVVAIINHPNANAARPAIDSLLNTLP